MEEFFHHNPVFTLQALQAHFGELSPRAAYERLRRALAAGRVVTVFRRVFATVPPGVDPASFQPDPFLILNALRPGAVFCGHSALDLYGVSNQIWHRLTGYSEGKAVTYKSGQATYSNFKRPSWVTPDAVSTVDRFGVFLQVTTPELTLIEGFRYPGRVGGIEELVQSADEFRYLDLTRLAQLLDRFNMRKLYSAVGWFLARDPAKWLVDDDYLGRLNQRRPASPLYLESRAAEGALDNKWNLIIPREVMGQEVTDIDRRRQTSSVDG